MSERESVRKRNIHFRETSQFSAPRGSNIVQLPKAVARRATGNCERPFASLLRFAPVDLSWKQCTLCRAKSDLYFNWQRNLPPIPPSVRV